MTIASTPPAPPAAPGLAAEQRGLSAAQVQRLLTLDGPNELEPPQRRTAWHAMQEVAREPMFQLLLAAGLVYLVLGSLY